MKPTAAGPRPAGDAGLGCGDPRFDAARRRWSEICRRIRQMTRYLPVIIISARTSEMHRVLGLEMGADDYLAKPFHCWSLSPASALFRRRGDGAESADGRRAPVLPWPEHRPLSREVKLRGETVDLTPREFDLLYYFARHPGSVFPPGLLEQVWDISTRA